MTRILATALILSSFLSGCAALAPVSEAPEAAAPRPSLKVMVRHHVRYHQNFPATRPEILAAIEGTAELTPEESAELAHALPGRRFENADDVMKAAFDDSRAALAVASIETCNESRSAVCAF